MLSFAYKRFDGVVPEPSPLDDENRALLAQIKEDPQAAAMGVCVILRVVDNLKKILVPILPPTAQKLHEYPGYDGQPFSGFSA